MRINSFAAAVLSLAVAAGALAQPRNREDNPVLREPASAADLGDAPGIIVKFRAGGASGRVQAQAAGDPVSKLAARGGFAIREARALPAGLHALKVERRPGESFAEQLARVRADSEVEFAEPDRRRFPHALPNDPLYTGQWYLQNRVDAPSAVHAEAAWDSGTGDAGVVIAVIDTGVLFDHPDLKRAHLGGRILPGYDFIANTGAANDGGGRDADATDAGDWVTQQESNQGQFAGCDVSNSSWHGTRVAGIIGALTNNSEGIAGSTWSSWILPVRALGKCGGFDSDILEAMAWAGGLHVSGVPDNPYPAKIENLSLGATGSCGPYGSMINQLAARGVVVVASAGNEGGPVGSPANCFGAAGVTGLRHAGTKVGFASLGPEVAIGAPGGNCVNVTGGPCLFSIDTTYNAGTTTPGAFGYTNQTNVNVGTSFSAPIVSGIVGLMAGANGNLGSAQLIARLREGATTPFPVSTDPTIPMCHVPASQNDLQTSECNCTTSTCGAGMANAAGALAAALRPIAALSAPANVLAGQNVNLTGAGSAGACNRTISTYFWQVVSGAGVLTGPNNTPTTSVNAPAPGSSITVRLTVTDDVGKQDSADIVINSTNTVTTAPANAGSNACPADIPPPAAITVAAAPVSASLVAGSGTQTFIATVANAQSNTSVTWKVDGVTGGNVTLGTISLSGVYTAPATVPAPAVVTVTATSVEDPTKSGSAQVTITAPAPAPSPPAASGGGGGGGFDLLVLLCALTAFARRARSMSTSARARRMPWTTSTPVRAMRTTPPTRG